MDIAVEAPPSIETPPSVPRVELARTPKGIDWRQEASRMPSEYRQQAPDIKPLKEIVLQRPGSTEFVDFTQHYTERLQNIAITMGVEMGTPRTTEMETWLKSMIKGDAELEARGYGDDNGIRVIIAQRGSQPYAEVFPDGTVIISQSAINALVTPESPGTQDELATILAHELAHLKRRTFERVVFGDEFKQKGAMFVHEGTADGDTQHYLEKAGFNSTAFKSAMKKTSKPSKTDVVHGSGNERVAQSEIQHTFVHSETSAQAQKPLPPEWIANEIIPTNDEIVGAMLQDVDTEVEDLRMRGETGENPVSLSEAKHVLENLYENDLFTVADDFSRSETMQQALVDLLQERLSGYSPAEIKAFLITLLSPKPQNLYPSIPEAVIVSRMSNSLLKVPLIQSASQLEDATLAIMHNGGTLAEMHRQLFNTAIDKRYPIIQMLSYMRTHMSLNPTEPYEFPIEWQQLEKVLLHAKSVDVPGEHPSGNEYKDYAIAYVAYRYLELKYGIDYQRATPLTETEATEIAAFLQKAVDAGIPLSYDNFQLWSRNHDNVSGAVAPSLDEVARSVLQKEDVEAVFHQKKEAFFAELSRCRETGEDPLEITNTFFKEVQNIFVMQKFSDEQRLPYIQQILEGISTIDMVSDHDLLSTLEGEYPRPATNQEQERMNAQLARFNLKLITAVRLFKQDGDEFYTTVKQIMDDSGIDVNTLSRLQIATLCIPLLRDGDNGQFSLYGFGANKYPDSAKNWGETVRKDNYDRLMALPFLQVAMQKDEQVPRDSLGDLYEYVSKRDQVIHFLSRSGPYYRREPVLYNDSLFGLVAFPGAEEAFLEMVKGGLSADERKVAYNFIARFYPQTEVAKRVRSTLLLQEMQEIKGGDRKAEVRAKIDFVVGNIHEVGYEGLTLLAEQITELEDFRILRSKLEDRFEELLKPESAGTAIAAYADTAMSKLLRNYELLLKSCLPEDRVRIEMSTQLASEWFKMALGRRESSSGGYSIMDGAFTYDENTHKLRPAHTFGSEKLLQSGRTVKELMSNLHGMPQSQKALILGKVLSEGPLSYAASPEDREVLAGFVRDILGLDEGFVTHLTESILRSAQGEELLVPVSTALSQYLFQALSMEHIDYASLEADRGIRNPLPRQDYQGLADAYSVDIMEGRFQAGSPFYDLAQQKIALFHRTQQTLERLFPIETSPERATDNQIPPNINALISGLEASNPLTIRALQSAYLLLDFQPALKRRLSNVFDRNPGMSKLWYWTNLDNYITKGGDDRIEYSEYRNIAEFAGEGGRLVAVQGKLGGGSFNTTYKGTVRDADGGTVEAAVKLLTPNAEFQMQQFYSLMVKAVHQMETQEPRVSRQELRLARKTLFLVKMAYEWSRNDLNNGTFQQDDPRFQEVMTQFNEQTGASFEASEVLFTSKLVNADRMASGETLIAILRDDTVPQDEKRALLERVGDFYDFQSRTPVTAADGSEEFLLQSDPNPGNFIVDRVTGRVTVIDRNYFLHLTRPQVEVLHSLRTGNYGRFFSQFIQTVIASNRVATGETKPDGSGIYTRREAAMKNAWIRSTLPAQLGLAFANELRKVGGNVRNIDPIDLMHVMFERFQATPLRQRTVVVNGQSEQITEAIEVPTDLLLAIKNVLIFSEQRRNGFKQGE